MLRIGLPSSIEQFLTQLCACVCVWACSPCDQVLCVCACVCVRVSVRACVGVRA